MADNALLFGALALLRNDRYPLDRAAAAGILFQHAEPRLKESS
jgi:hypothetical protein